MVIVTVKNSRDKLVSMFTQKFRTVKAAVEAIREDAAAFKSCHGGKLLNPKDTDHFEVNGEDGEQCVWQYFQM